MTCQKCKKTTAVVNYNGGKYCNWYCAKNANKIMIAEKIHETLGKEKDGYDFNEAMNGDYTGFDSFLEKNLIA
tara:strand:- start:5 stop:223 length:219 start_codon:yes stop_codon:yes gene_type:complete